MSLNEVDPQKESIDGLSKTNIQQSSAALQIQTYCFAVIEQPDVKFDIESDKLEELQNNTNSFLKKARDHGRNFNGKLVPLLIQNIINIDNQMQLQQAVPTILPEGSTKDEWITVLKAIADQARKYEAKSLESKKKIDEFSSNVTADVANFNRVKTDVNSEINGDNGVLAGLDENLKSIDKQIAGEISGIALSGIAIVGGGILVAVGTIGDFVTAGTSTPIAVAGGALIIGGVAGEAGSVVGLTKTLDAKSDIIQQESGLKAEVKALTLLESNINTLAVAAASAATAAQAMANAWSTLASSFENFASDIKTGTTSVGLLRKLFLTAANTSIASIMEEIKTIKNQFTGVKLVIGKQGEKLVDVIGRIHHGEPIQSSLQQNTYSFSQNNGSIKVDKPFVGNSDSEISKRNKNTATTGLMMQTYALSVVEQEDLNIASVRGLEKLEPINNKINKALATARSHAGDYLHRVEPLILNNITDVEHHYTVQDTISSVLPPGTKKEIWLQTIAELSVIAKESWNKASTTIRELQNLKASIDNDYQTLSNLTSELNNVVEGDSGVLATLQANLDSVTKQINGDIAGVVFSSLGIVGGSVMTVIGAVATLETGTGPSMVVGGVSMIAAGLAGDAAAGSDLHSSLVEKGTIISQQTVLTNEVKLAASMENGFSGIVDVLEMAVSAATEMKVSWETMMSDLEELSSNLQDGLLSPDAVRSVFLEASKNEVEGILEDIKIIKEQMSGVEVVTNSKQSIARMDDTLRHRKLRESQVFLSLVAIDSSTKVNNMSEVIAQFASDGRKVLSIGGLPTTAATDRHHISNLITVIPGHIKQFQGHATAFSQKAMVLVNNALSTIQKPIVSDKMFTQALMGYLSALESLYKTMDSDCISAANELATYQEEMAGVVRSNSTELINLTKHRSALEAELHDVKHALDKAKKTQLAMIALGPFGLVGLSAAIAVVVTTQKKMNDIIKKGRSFENQLSMFKRYMTNLNSFQNSLRALILQTSKLQNDISILTGQLLTIQNDTQKRVEPKSMVLFLHAATSMITEFRNQSA